MSLQQRQLFLHSCGGHLGNHRRVQVAESGERSLPPGAFRNPGRVLEHPSKRLDKALFVKSVDVGKRHATSAL
jgi:hypothetical protein